MHEAVAAERPEALPEQRPAQAVAFLRGEFADGDDEPPAAIPQGGAGGVDVARGVLEAALARTG